MFSVFLACTNKGSLSASFAEGPDYFTVVEPAALDPGFVFEASLEPDSEDIISNSPVAGENRFGGSILLNMNSETDTGPLAGDTFLLFVTAQFFAMDFNQTGVQATDRDTRSWEAYVESNAEEGFVGLPIEDGWWTADFRTGVVTFTASYGAINKLNVECEGELVFPEGEDTGGTFDTALDNSDNRRLDELNCTYSRSLDPIDTITVRMNRVE